MKINDCQSETLSDVSRLHARLLVASSRAPHLAPIALMIQSLGDADDDSASVIASVSDKWMITIKMPATTIYLIPSSM